MNYVDYYFIGMAIGCVIGVICGAVKTFSGNH